MTRPAYLLIEANAALDEVGHLVGQYAEDTDSWTPLEELLATVDLMAWILSREIEDVERPGPAALRPA